MCRVGGGGGDNSSCVSDSLKCTDSLAAWLTTNGSKTINMAQSVHGIMYTRTIKPGSSKRWEILYVGCATKHSKILNCAFWVANIITKQIHKMKFS